MNAIEVSRRPEIGAAPAPAMESTGSSGSSGSTVPGASPAAPVILPQVNGIVPRVNGIALAGPNEALDAADLRQRACTELLRQAAMREGLLAMNDPDPVDGIGSEAASEAIEALLEQRLQLPEPDVEACRRHHASHAGDFTVGERLRARHVLFAVTPGVDVKALRSRAEACLIELRASGDALDARFAVAAREWSNCPSGASGGDLGWLEKHDCAPEFAASLFGTAQVGVLAQLVHSRFGLHVVEVLAREPGALQPFETVQPAIVQTLSRQRFATALRDYLQRLAEDARLEGVDLDAATVAPAT